MAISKTAVSVLASTASSAGTTTKTSPSITGSAVSCTSYYGGELTYKITNGTAPGTALQGIFQASHDATNWYDYSNTFAGDLVTSSVNSGSVLLDRGVMYIRVIVWGNTTNAVTIEANLQAVTGI